MEPRTLGDIFLKGLASQKLDRILEKREGRYQPVSTEEFGRRVFAVAAALAKRGISKGDRVAILSYNRPEWAILDYAAQLLGAPTVPLYSTLPPDAVGYILKDSEARLVVVENEVQKEKVLKSGMSIDVAIMGPEFEAWYAASADRQALEEQASRIQEDDLATLIYTSGTTGICKGVMLTHRNLVSNLTAITQFLSLSSDDLTLSFLPLSHIFQRLVDYALFSVGASIAYAESVDAVANNLLEVQPTLMAAVPRFYEKVYAKIQDTILKMPPKKRKMVHWALSTGRQEAQYRMRGTSTPLGLSVKYALAKGLVLKKFHARTGGRIRIFVSGGAPLSQEIAEFFFSVGFTILEGYGLTESSVISVNRSGGTKLGTVGQILPGITVKIAKDGEILAKGPNIMKGYYHLPKETEEMLKDGWLYTGDIGEIDAEGFLKITDRKKDLIKTSCGKYIAPQPIENKLKMSPLIANAVVIGDRRKFCSALLAPNFEAVQSAAKEKNLPYDHPKDLLKSQDIAAMFGQEVERVNRDLPHHEKIKKFSVLDQDFTINGGELTPTMKVRRKVVEQHYKPLIDSLYREEEAAARSPKA